MKQDNNNAICIMCRDSLRTIDKNPQNRTVNSRKHYSFFLFFLPPPFVAGLSGPFPPRARAVRALLRTLLLGEGRSQISALCGELQDGGFGVEPGGHGPDVIMLTGP